ncbi:MAG: hypothetical protein VW771_07265, partial [Gammaproteobacteria bacterium]
MDDGEGIVDYSDQITSPPLTSGMEVIKGAMRPKMLWICGCASLAADSLDYWETIMPSPSS